jgi:FMN-dependent NADH-azoreductase
MTVLLTIRSNGETKQYTLSEALKFVEEIKEKYQKVNYANQSYRKCVEVLYSINEHNRRLISRWNLNEEDLFNLRNCFFQANTEPNQQLSTNSKSEQNTKTNDKIISDSIDNKTSKQLLL